MKARASVGDIGYNYRPKGWRARGPKINGRQELIGAFYTRAEAENALAAWWIVKALAALGQEGRMVA